MQSIHVSKDHLIDFFDEKAKISKQLRETYFQYLDFKNNGLLNLKKKIIQGKAHLDYDLNNQQYNYEQKQHIFFENPDVQQEFFTNFIKCVSDDMKPKLALDSHTNCTAKEF